MPFALFNIYLLLIHGVFPELAPLEQVLCCFVGIHSKQLMFVAHFFFLTKVWNRPPLELYQILNILCKQFSPIFNM